MRALCVFFRHGEFLCVVFRYSSHCSGCDDRTFMFIYWITVTFEFSLAGSDWRATEPDTDTDVWTFFFPLFLSNLSNLGLLCTVFSCDGQILVGLSGCQKQLVGARGLKPSTTIFILMGSEIRIKSFLLSFYLKINSVFYSSLYDLLG